MKRRDFVKTAAVGAAAGAVPAVAGAAVPDDEGRPPAPVIHTRSTRPVLVADVSSIRYRNGGPESAIERAFRGIAEGEDVLDACVAGVNIPELDPEERGIGYGGLPNADGVVQLDSCLMHGPRRWAGGVAGLEGVKTPSLVAKAVAELTDHHLMVGKGAQEFARSLGFEIQDDLNTAASRELWLEWRRRVDPGHWLDPEERLRDTGRVGEDADPDAIRPGRGPGSVRRADILHPGRARVPGPHPDPDRAARLRRFQQAALAAGLSMVDDGLIDPDSFWGTTSRGSRFRGRGSLRRDHHQRPLLEDPGPGGGLPDPRRRPVRRQRCRRGRLRRGAARPTSTTSAAS